MPYLLKNMIDPKVLTAHIEAKIEYVRKISNEPESNLPYCQGMIYAYKDIIEFIYFGKGVEK